MSLLLPLPKDVHVPVAPGWWPPAPGWWGVLALVVLLGCLLAWWRHARRRRRARLLELFDAQVDAASTPAAQVAAMSELLRRAARRHDAFADRLEGEDWLRFLDAGMKSPVFERGPGRLLLDGGFRSDVDAEAVRALREPARMRYLLWMRGE